MVTSDMSRNDLINAMQDARIALAYLPGAAHVKDGQIVVEVSEGSDSTLEDYIAQALGKAERA